LLNADALGVDQGDLREWYRHATDIGVIVFDRRGPIVRERIFEAGAGNPSRCGDADAAGSERDRICIAEKIVGRVGPSPPAFA
jgi:hypothetical protein